MHKIHQKLIFILLVMLSSVFVSACDSCNKGDKNPAATNGFIQNNAEKNNERKKKAPTQPTAGKNAGEPAGKTRPEIASESPKKESGNNQVKTEIQKRIKNEIVETEISYNQSIKKLNSLFLIPLSTNKKLKNNEPVKTFINNLTQVLNPLIIISDSLQAELEKAKDASGVISTKELGEIFKKHAPYLSYFQAFTASYESISEQFKNLQQNTTFKKFLDTQHKNPSLNQLDLKDLLIMPIQRLQKYPLLLKELLKHTSQEDEAYKTLVEALKQVEEAVNDVNNAIPTNPIPNSAKKK